MNSIGPFLDFPKALPPERSGGQPEGFSNGRLQKYDWRFCCGQHTLIIPFQVCLEL